MDYFVVSVNITPETGETSYFVLGRFYRLENAHMMLQGLQSRNSSKNGEEIFAIIQVVE